MNYISTIILILSINMFSLVSLAQPDFVVFETTNQGNIVCQGQALGVIAKLASQYDGYTTYKWQLDTINLLEAHGLLAIVNTSTFGEKIISFSLDLGKDIMLDTSMTVAVLPNPEVTIDLKDKIISFSTNSNAEFSSYRWVHNKTVLPESTKKSIIKPDIGEYKVVVTDSNGCKATSASITVE